MQETEEGGPAEEGAERFPPAPDKVTKSIDLLLPGQEGQNVAHRLPGMDLEHSGEGCIQVALLRLLCVHHLYRVLPSLPPNICIGSSVIRFVCLFVCSFLCWFRYCTTTDRCRLKYPVGTCWTSNNVLKVSIGSTHISQRGSAIAGPSAIRHIIHCLVVYVVFRSLHEIDFLTKFDSRSSIKNNFPTLVSDSTVFIHGCILLTILFGQNFASICVGRR